MIYSSKMHLRYLNAELYNFDFTAVLEPLFGKRIQYYSSRYSNIDSKFLTVFKHRKKALEQAQIPRKVPHQCIVEVFDFVYPDGVRVKGNGFRSLLYMYHSALSNLLHIVRHWDRQHGYVTTELIDNVQVIVWVLNGVKLILEYADKLAKEQVSEVYDSVISSFSDGGIATVLKRLDDIEHDCFYSHCLGFKVRIVMLIIMWIVWFAPMCLMCTISRGPSL